MTKEPIALLKDLMMRQGGVIVIGCRYAQAMKTFVPPDVGKAVFGAAKIDDLEIPDALMIGCSLVFCHDLSWCRGRGATRPELEKWGAALLEGIVLRPAAVPGLAPAEISEPKQRFLANEANNELVFLVQWGPVPSRHCVEIARALERAWARIS